MTLLEDAIESVFIDRFEIRTGGSEPDGYRLSLRCHEVLCDWRPEVYSAGLLDSTGESLLAPDIGLGVGLAGENLVLYWRPMDPEASTLAIGHAQNLDDIRPFTGVVIRGQAIAHPLGSNWTLDIQVDDGAEVEPFEGEVFTPELALLRWARHHAGLSAEPFSANLEVIETYLIHVWVSIRAVPDPEEAYFSQVVSVLSPLLSGEIPDSTGELGIQAHRLLTRMQESLCEHVEDPRLRETVQRDLARRISG